MKTTISTSKAPGAIGPYSQGIRCAGLVFTSGQLGIHPETGEMPVSIQEQTRQSLENVKSVLEAAGSGLDKAVKMTVFLKDMNDFVAMNEIYQEFFQNDFPARSAVEVARLPKDARIEIEAVAHE